jgi:hypothetical protein
MRVLFPLLFVACSSPCLQARDAGLSGATVSDGTTTYTYGLFHWGKNNDCGPASITIDGTQQTPATTTPFHFAFCIPDPGSPGDTTIPVDGTHIVDLGVSGTDGVTTFTSDAPTAQTTASFAFHGLCADTRGTAFTISLSGALAGMQLPSTNLTLQLGGTVTVWGE